MLLRDKDRQSLIQIFSSVKTPMEVWAYGSRVTGTAHDGSDLDLVARSPDLKPLPIAVYLKLREKITNSNIPILVELWDWAKLPASFHKNIEKQFEVLYSNFAINLNESGQEFQTKKPEGKDEK
ncbi:MAG: nucleotidyltransferase family protein [Mucilaginibacter sp.]|uniref:nucleotidyltransferase family protein n=1 Tax=Mucilaginibacter sp. TaxID=1882438 RepID=UPI0034E382E8